MTSPAGYPMFVGESGNRSIHGYHDGTLVIWIPAKAEERQHRFACFVRMVSRGNNLSGRAFLLPPHEPFSPGFNTVAEADRYIKSQLKPEPRTPSPLCPLAGRREGGQ